MGYAVSPNEFALFMEVTITESRKKPFTAGPARSTLTFFMPKQTLFPQALPWYVRSTVSNLPCSNHFGHQMWDCGSASQMVQAGSAPSKSVELHCCDLFGVLAQYPAFSAFKKASCWCVYLLQSSLFLPLLFSLLSLSLLQPSLPCPLSCQSSHRGHC